MVVPPKLLTYMNKKRNNGANRDTVMKEFRESNSYIKMVDDATWAATAGTNGSPALIFYVRDPDHLELHLPGAFQQKIKFQSEVDTSFLLLMDTAGVRHKRLSALIVEGFWY